MEKRNMAIADSTVANMQMKRAKWTNWTVKRAVDDGMNSSGWVYLAVSKISEAVGSVPLIVVDKDGKRAVNHHIDALMTNPHPTMSRTEIMELMSSWMSLTGTAYLHKVKGEVLGRTREIYPFSPDRLSPLASTNSTSMISGYQIKDKSGKIVTSSKYTTDTIIRICKSDPANPLEGISPLKAAAKAVDLDVSQQDWNLALMKNRGNTDIAIITKSGTTEVQKNSIMRSVLRKFRGVSNAGMPLLLGDEAKIERLGLSQTEMDFLNSRKWNRDEILAMFGVPSQLAGAQESSTYNNFIEARRIFWMGTVLPHLNRMIDAINQSLLSELSGGYKIIADLSQVSALGELLSEKLKSAKILREMGVPVSVINKKLDLGIDEYDNWDKSERETSKSKSEERGDKLESFFNRLDSGEFDSLLNE